jgi:periplasmic protein TonB
LNKLNYRWGVPDVASRAVIFVLVLSAHAAVFVGWDRQSNIQPVPNRDLSVSFAISAAAPQPAVAAQSKPAIPVPEPMTAEESMAPAEQVPVVAASSLAAAQTLSPAVADTEPDYKAAYLNNPPPAYPMVARRNGLQGRVVLHVEVLANGTCGKINIKSSSGYAMLDNAALNTVKTWRFTPARQGGLAVDKWFMIPVQFSLKDNAT